MHVLFVHPNFPAQFGHVADYLARRHGYRCTFVSERPPGTAGAVERIPYRTDQALHALRARLPPDQAPDWPGATRHSHYCSRTFENAVWHAHAVYEALQGRPDVRPDLVVGHSGFGSTLFLRELYDCPVVNYFEFFYRPRHSDMDFRPDFPTTELDRLRALARNAMLLLDLENCDAGYSPTRWQRDRLPAPFRDKVRVIFDGIDTDLWRPEPEAPRLLGGQAVPEDVRVVTYVARGMESMRGFDLFMRVAKRLCDRRRDVVFVVAGQDRVCYGGDERFTGGKTFKEWVLAQEAYDLSRFLFVGLVPPAELARLLALSDLHLYWTVPFVLSWSLLDALACGATVLASDTGPVREVIEHGRNGLLCDFFDVDAWAEMAGKVLDAPREYRHLGEAGVETIRERYSMEVCLPRMVELYQVVVAGRQSPAG